MERMVFACLVLFFFLTGCAHLEVKPEEIPSADEIAELQKVLDEISYRGCWDYQLEVFDCSNQSAFLYNMLMIEGYKSNIIFGINPSSLSLPEGWHAWLIASKNGKKFWIEPTVKGVVTPDNYRRYAVKIRLGSLKRAKRITRIIFIIDWFFPKQWDY